MAASSSAILQGGASAAASEQVPSASVADLPILLDVRPASDFAERHLERSVNIPFEDLPSRAFELSEAAHLSVVIPDAASLAQLEAWSLERRFRIASSVVASAADDQAQALPSSDSAARQWHTPLNCNCPATGYRLWKACPPLEDHIDRLEAAVRQIRGQNCDLRALDLGCGVGRDSVFLAKRGWHVVSVDNSAPLVQRLTEFAQRSGASVAERITGTCLNLDIEYPSLESASASAQPPVDQAEASSSGAVKLHGDRGNKGRGNRKGKPPRKTALSAEENCAEVLRLLTAGNDSVCASSAPKKARTEPDPAAAGSEGAQAGAACSGGGAPPPSNDFSLVLLARFLNRELLAYLRRGDSVLQRPGCVLAIHHFAQGASSRAGQHFSEDQTLCSGELRSLFGEAQGFKILLDVEAPMANDSQQRTALSFVAIKL